MHIKHEHVRISWIEPTNLRATRSWNASADSHFCPTNEHLELKFQKLSCKSESITSELIIADSLLECFVGFYCLQECLRMECVCVCAWVYQSSGVSLCVCKFCRVVRCFADHNAAQGLQQFRHWCVLLSYIKIIYIYNMQEFEPRVSLKTTLLQLGRCEASEHNLN